MSARRLACLFRKHRPKDLEDSEAYGEDEVTSCRRCRAWIHYETKLKAGVVVDGRWRRLTKPEVRAYMDRVLDRAMEKAVARTNAELAIEGEPYRVGWLRGALFTAEPGSHEPAQHTQEES